MPRTSANILLGRTRRRFANVAPILVSAIFAGAIAAGCGKPIGTACRSTGSGFQRSDDCAGWCMEHWPVRCADGSQRTRALCSGKTRCKGADCGEGQVCYLGTNSFPVCLPNDWCPAWNPQDLR